METEQMVAAIDFCIYHNIELSFISSLNESGLIDITSIEEKIFVPVSQLKHVEKLMRLNAEPDNNFESTETITYLLQRINDMHQHIVKLNDTLALRE
jgi:hypothetical protein